MSKIKKILALVLIAVSISTSTLASAETVNSITVQDYSYIESMQAVQGVGNHLGETELRGFPQNDKYKIYYSGNSQSYSVKTDDFTVDHTKQVIWYYKGVKHVNTVQECYAFFIDTTVYRDYYGQSNNFLSETWFTNTFGQIFEDWQNYISFTDEATRIVEKYLNYKEGIVYTDRYSLADLDLDLSEYYDNSDNNNIDGIY